MEPAVSTVKDFDVVPQVASVCGVARTFRVAPPSAAAPVTATLSLTPE